ncbi:uncharacterized protein STEHIDRAFT_125077, partial [Stereum hirsutum FP-91666 SS1]|uniref:uncharacterized protein n=1 Tax=Stereum hirsutum (strain FP-91666) TaxID=721885 RepID=UPI000444A91A
PRPIDVPRAGSPTPSRAFLSPHQSLVTPSLSRTSTAPVHPPPKPQTSIRRRSDPLSRASEDLKVKQKEELRAAAKALEGW